MSNKSLYSKQKKFNLSIDTKIEDLYRFIGDNKLGNYVFFENNLESNHISLDIDLNSNVVFDELYEYFIYGFDNDINSNNSIDFQVLMFLITNDYGERILEHTSSDSHIILYYELLENNLYNKSLKESTEIDTLSKFAFHKFKEVFENAKLSDVFDAQFKLINKLFFHNPNAVPDYFFDYIYDDDKCGSLTHYSRFQDIKGLFNYFKLFNHGFSFKEFYLDIFNKCESFENSNVYFSSSEDIQELFHKYMTFENLSDENYYSLSLNNKTIMHYVKDYNVNKDTTSTLKFYHNSFKEYALSLNDINLLLPSIKTDFLIFKEEDYKRIKDKNLFFNRIIDNFINDIEGNSFETSVEVLKNRINFLMKNVLVGNEQIELFFKVLEERISNDKDIDYSNLVESITKYLSYPNSDKTVFKFYTKNMMDLIFNKQFNMFGKEATSLNDLFDNPIFLDNSTEYLKKLDLEDDKVSTILQYLTLNHPTSFEFEPICSLNFKPSSLDDNLENAYFHQYFKGFDKTPQHTLDAFFLKDLSFSKEMIFFFFDNENFDIDKYDKFKENTTISFNKNALHSFTIDDFKEFKEKCSDSIKSINILNTKFYRQIMKLYVKGLIEKTDVSFLEDVIENDFKCDIKEELLEFMQGLLSGTSSNVNKRFRDLEVSIGDLCEFLMGYNNSFIPSYLHDSSLNLKPVIKDQLYLIFKKESKLEKETVMRYVKLLNDKISEGITIDHLFDLNNYSFNEVLDAIKHYDIPVYYSSKVLHYYLEHTYSINSIDDFKEFNIKEAFDYLYDIDNDDRRNFNYNNVGLISNVLKYIIKYPDETSNGKPLLPSYLYSNKKVSTETFKAFNLHCNSKSIVFPQESIDYIKEEILDKAMKKLSSSEDVTNNDIDSFFNETIQYGLFDFMESMQILIEHFPLDIIEAYFFNYNSIHYINDFLDVSHSDIQSIIKNLDYLKQFNKFNCVFSGDKKYDSSLLHDTEQNVINRYYLDDKNYEGKNVYYTMKYGYDLDSYRDMFFSFSSNEKQDYLYLSDFKFALNSQSKEDVYINDVINVLEHIKNALNSSDKQNVHLTDYFSLEVLFVFLEKGYGLDSSFYKDLVEKEKEPNTSSVHISMKKELLLLYVNESLEYLSNNEGQNIYQESLINKVTNTDENILMSLSNSNNEDIDFSNEDVIINLENGSNSIKNKIMKLIELKGFGVFEKNFNFLNNGKFDIFCKQHFFEGFDMSKSEFDKLLDSSISYYKSADASSFEVYNAQKKFFTFTVLSSLSFIFEKDIDLNIIDTYFNKGDSFVHEESYHYDMFNLFDILGDKKYSKFLEEYGNLNSNFYMEFNNKNILSSKVKNLFHKKMHESLTINEITNALEFNSIHSCYYFNNIFLSNNYLSSLDNKTRKKVLIELESIDTNILVDFFNNANPSSINTMINNKYLSDTVIEKIFEAMLESNLYQIEVQNLNIQKGLYEFFERNKKMFESKGLDISRFKSLPYQNIKDFNFNTQSNFKEDIPETIKISHNYLRSSYLDFVNFDFLINSRKYDDFILFLEKDAYIQELFDKLTIPNLETKYLDNKLELISELNEKTLHNRDLIDRYNKLQSDLKMKDDIDKENINKSIANMEEEYDIHSIKEEIKIASKQLDKVWKSWYKDINVKLSILNISVISEISKNRVDEKVDLYDDIKNISEDNLDKEVFDSLLKIYNTPFKDITFNDLKTLSSTFFDKNFVLSMFFKEDIMDVSFSDGLERKFGNLNDMLIDEEKFNEFKQFNMNKYNKVKYFVISEWNDPWLDNLDEKDLYYNDNMSTLNMLLFYADFDMKKIQKWLSFFNKNGINVNTLHSFDLSFIANDNLDLDYFQSYVSKLMLFLQKKSDSKVSLDYILRQNINFFSVAFESIDKITKELGDLRKVSADVIYSTLLLQKFNLNDLDMIDDIQHCLSSASYNDAEFASLSSKSEKAINDISKTLKNVDRDELYENSPFLYQKQLLDSNNDNEIYIYENIPVFDGRTYGQGFATSSCLTPDGLASNILPNVAENPMKWNTLVVSKLKPDINIKGSLFLDFKKDINEYNSLLLDGKYDKVLYDRLTKFIKSNFYMSGAGVTWAKENQGTIDNMEVNHKTMVDVGGSQQRINVTESHIVDAIEKSTMNSILYSSNKIIDKYVSLLEEYDGENVSSFRFDYGEFPKVPLIYTIGSGYSDISLDTFRNKTVEVDSDLYKVNDNVYTDAKREQQVLINHHDKFSFSDSYKYVDYLHKIVKSSTSKDDALNKLSDISKSVKKRISKNLIGKHKTSMKVTSIKKNKK